MTNQHAIKELTRSFLQKDSLEDCSIKDLETLVDKEPYSPLPRFLLARKLKELDSPLLREQSDLLGLYFNNPFWAAHLLSGKGKAEVEKKIVTADETNQIVNPSDEIVESVPASEIPSNDNYQKPPNSALNFAEVDQEEPAILPVHAEEKVLITPVEEEISMTKDEEEETEDEESQREPEDLPLIIPGLKIEPFDPATAKISFEPYHMVDYFASQGIKIKEEQKPGDKFGQQLKSFTEWIKTLKKVPAGEINAIPTEKRVDQLAEHSLADREVVTEAMAEVWIKQGNKPKAITVYQKLSLINPSKSSYFAGLIEQLKQS